jgi:hypothetical protein
MDCKRKLQIQMNYKDSELYSMRFRQCMTRGLSLIKIHFVKIIKNVTLDIWKVIKDKVDR